MNYKNPSLPVEERLASLMQEMTLPEKVGQLMQLNGRDEKIETQLREMQPGSLLFILGERAGWAMDIVAESRLGIPLLIGQDCIHGHSFWEGATIFPSQLAMACAWEPELCERVARITALESAPTGVHWTFSPVLCLTRDLRWGRVNETFGEDPLLIGELAEAMVRGYQGKGLEDPDGILACAKHYGGYSETQGGRDASEADITPRKLLSWFLPPFERVAKAGCATFMVGYQAIDGVPCTTNAWLLDELLRKQWGFDGALVTDWDNVGRMNWEQKIYPTLEEATRDAIRAGNDLIMATPDSYQAAIHAVEKGVMKEEEIDEPVKRILRLKLRMGLFENPRRPDPAKLEELIQCQDHQDANLDAARKSLVLLQNRDGFLPIARDQFKRVAVIGPNADDSIEHLGDWALGCGNGDAEKAHPRELTVTVLEGIRQVLGDTVEVVYEKGCDGQTDDLSQIPAAVQAAKEADLVIMVAGDRQPFVGELCSTATLELMGGQKELFAGVAKLAKPTVAILINSKPLVLPESVRNADAILEAFNPGMKGGQAVAEALVGDLNPGGKLPISFAPHVGAQPCTYGQVRGEHGGKYADCDRRSPFPFGFGLSYTTYAYSDLVVKNSGLQQGEDLEVSVKVKNTGSRDGEEIVQLYIEDLFTSVTWVQKELKAYRKVAIAAGESKQIDLRVPYSDLSIVNARCERVVEPGGFRVMVGPSSRDEDLLSAEFRVA